MVLLATLVVFASCSKTEKFDLNKNKNNSSEIELENLVEQARQLSDSSNTGDFISIYEKALQIMESYPDTSIRKAEVRLFFIKNLIKAGALTQAIEQSHRALLLNQLGLYDESIYFQLQVYGNLAIAYVKIGQMDSAIVVSRKSIRIAKFHSDSLWVTSSLNNAGMFFYQNGDVDSAMKYFREADKMLKTYQGPRLFWKTFHGSVKDNMATIYNETGKFEKAREIYRENFDRYANTKQRSRWINAGISLALTDIDLKDYANAIQMINQIEFIMDTAIYDDRAETELSFLKVKSKYYKAVNDPENALLYNEKALKLTESLNATDEIMRDKVVNMLSEYTSDQFEKAFMQEKIAREKEEQRALLRLWILILVLLGGTITPLLIFNFYRQRVKLLETDKLLTKEKLNNREKERQILNLQLENKKKDLAQLAMNLSQKQKWARELNAQIKKVNSVKGYKRSREIKKLQEEIRSQVYVDKEMGVVQQNMDTLNSEFYTKLQEQFPGLSKTEIKLCSYIKLNLDSSQIAQLQNIEPSSVKVSRYRLKKKLHLSPDMNLDTFIQSL